MQPAPDGREAAILEETLSLLGRDHGKGDGLYAFRRLLTKHMLGRKPRFWHIMRIRRQDIRSSRQSWSTAELAALMGGGHAKASPRTEHGTDAPVIVVYFRGAVRLLDGGNRINRWLAEGDAGPHKVNFHIVGK